MDQRLFTAHAKDRLILRPRLQATNRENHLLPVDFEAAGEADVPYTAYPANRVHDLVERSGARPRIMILDACRDNPYKSSRGEPSGFAPMASTAEAV